MGKLNELKRLAMEELENFADRGLSTQTVGTAKNLASLICKIDCIEQQSEYNQHSRGDYPDYRHNDGMGGIGMPAYSQRRDGAELNEETRRELKRILDKLGS